MRLDLWQLGFQFQNLIIAVEAGLLMVWDTTLITDGDYQLRLRAYSEDNSINEFVISFISIRNYTPTVEPSPLAMSVFVDPTDTRINPTESPVVRPTNLPENPLELSSRNLAMSLVYGFLSILGLIVISSIYSRWQRK